MRGCERRSAAFSTVVVCLAAITGVLGTGGRGSGCHHAQARALCPVVMRRKELGSSVGTHESVGPISGLLAHD